MVNHKVQRTLTEAQKSEIAEWLPTKPLAQEKEQYAKAFGHAASSLHRQDELTTGCRAPKRTEHLARVPLRNITRANKQRAIDEHRPIKEAIQRRIRQSGPPTNVGKFIDELHDAGVTTRENGKRYRDSAIRKMVVEYTGIKGAGGRRRHTKKISLDQ